MKKHYRKENDCLNCGTILEGKFCHNCGQENLELKESFGHLMNHAVSDYFHFDHQFFKTLKPLLFKPGFLTNEYMSGKRVQYLHPVKMYIFISVVYFLVIFHNGTEVVKIRETGNAPVKSENSIDSTKKKIADNPLIPNATKKDIEKDLDKSKEADKNGVVFNIDYQNSPDKWFHPTTPDTTYEEYLSNQKKLPAEKQATFLESVWNKKVFSYREKYGIGAREEFVDNLKHNTPKMMFLLLPLFAMILRFAFWKNRKFYVEHLIYTLDLFCFLFLFLGIVMLLQMVLPKSWTVVYGLVTFLATLYMAWYIFRSLRVVYQRSRFRTITKMIGMSFMYFIAFTFCIGALFVITTIV